MAFHWNRVRQPRFGWTLVLILVVAAALRLSWLGVVEFKYDEAMISRRALDFVHSAIWPASTISSVPGVPQPPMKALLLAVPYAFTRNPSFAAAFQSLLGSLTVALTGWFGRRYFGARVGIIAAIFLASAPWAVFYDRKLWSENVPLLTILMMIGVYAYIVDRKPRAIVLASAMCGLLIGFYLADAILGVILIIGLILFWRSTGMQRRGVAGRKMVTWLAVGAPVLIVTLIPYALDFASRPPSPTTTLRQDVLPTPSFTLPDQILYAASVGNGYLFHSLAGDHMAEYTRTLPLPDLSDVLDLPVTFLTIAGMFYVLTYAAVSAIRLAPIKRHLNASYGLLSLWIFAPVTVWSLSGQPAYPHRYVMLYPAQVIAAAVLIGAGWQWFSYRGASIRVVIRATAVLLLVALTAWHFVVFNHMMSFVSTHSIAGGHGQPVGKLWAVAQQARLMASDGLPTVIYSEGDDPEHDAIPAVFDALLGDNDLRFVIAPDLELRTTQAHVDLRASGDGDYRVSFQPAAPTSTDAGIARLDNGVDVLTVRVTPVGQASLELTFRIWSSPPEGRNYGYSVQIYDGAQPLGQVDGAFLKSAYWRQGDIIVVNSPFAPDALTKATRVLISMYSYKNETEIEGVNILDIAGNPAGQQVIIPLTNH